MACILISVTCLISEIVKNFLKLQFFLFKSAKTKIIGIYLIMAPKLHYQTKTTELRGLKRWFSSTYLQLLQRTQAHQCQVAHSPAPRNPPPFSSLLRHPYTHINKNKINLKKGKKAERWLKQLRACTVFAEDPSEVSSTQVRQLTATSNYSSNRIHSLWPLGSGTHMHTPLHTYY